MIMMGPRPAAARSRNQAQPSVSNLLSLRSSATSVTQENIGTTNNFLDSVNVAPSSVEGVVSSIPRGASVIACTTPTSKGQGDTRNTTITALAKNSGAPCLAPTTTTPLSDRQAPGGGISTFVCPAKFQEYTAKPRNTSPFDPKKYFPLLPPQLPHMKGRVTLALDLDETLVHSTVVPIVRTSSGRRQFFLRTEVGADSPVLLEEGNKACAAPLRQLHGRSDLVLTLGEGTDREEMVFVQFRPHAQAFLTFASEHFEVIIFTASRSCYADPVMQALMPSSTRRDDETQPLASGVRVASQNALSSPASPLSPSSQQKLRLYREHCADVGGAKVKDMSLLGRALEKVVLIDNLASSFLFQPRNGVLIKSWYGESGDTELLMLLDLLRDLATAPDVVQVLDVYNSTVVVTPQATSNSFPSSPQGACNSLTNTNCGTPLA